MQWCGRACAGISMLLIFAGALAGSYDDYSKAMSAYTAGYRQQALDGFTAALTAGDLAAPYIPVAYSRRGALYLERGECTKAASDIEAAIKLEQAEPFVHQLQIAADFCLKDEVKAEKDFSVMLAKWPDKEAQTRLNYGIDLWIAGRYSAASDNFMRSLQTITHSSKWQSYSLLLYAISSARAGNFMTADFKKTAGKLSRNWPAPLFDFYLGHTDAKTIRADIADENAELALRHSCEANFYIGQWQRIHATTDAEKADAISQIHEAADKCPRSFLEYKLAKTELNRKN